MGYCDECGKRESLPYECKYCGYTFCSDHRLPENHSCEGLESYREGMQAEGRMFAPKDDMGRTSSGGILSRLPIDFRGNAAYAILASIVVVYILQQVVLFTVSASLHNTLFVLGPDFVSEPWTVITSIFSHDPGNIWHILVNGMVLFFFGPALERMVGTKRFSALYFVAGVAAGLGFVLATGASVLGASGAIFGVMGAMTALRPNMRVYVNFFIPMPLWVLTLLYAAFSLLMIPSGGARGVADLAHLIGLVIGLVWGYSWKGSTRDTGRGGLGGPLGGRRGPGRRRF